MPLLDIQITSDSNKFVTSDQLVFLRTLKASHLSDDVIYCSPYCTGALAAALAWNCFIRRSEI